jgi:hypothetical protein
VGVSSGCQQLTALLTHSFIHYFYNTIRMKFEQTEQTEITVSPPESLVKYEAPLFVGIEPSERVSERVGGALKKSNPNNTKLEDMVDSIIPAR